MATTGHSKLDPGLWCGRYCRLLRRIGRTGGYLFAFDNNPPKLCDFDDMFYGVLEALQARCPDLIPAEMDVREVFGILRSLRRGVAAHALNMKIDIELINAINRWRAERKGSHGPRMVDHYADLPELKPTMLGYSGAI